MLDDDIKFSQKLPNYQIYSSDSSSDSSVGKHIQAKPKLLKRPKKSSTNLTRGRLMKSSSIDKVSQSIWCLSHTQFIAVIARVITFFFWAEILHAWKKYINFDTWKISVRLAQQKKSIDQNGLFNP